MKTKLFLLFVGIMILLLNGCGTAYYENVSYYDPNWLTDGRIMAVKSVERHRSEGIAGYGRDILASSGQYIVSMKDDGSDERTIYGGEGKGIGIPVASPLGNYIAYRSGQYINIITADGTKEIKTLDCGETPQSMDWSPDETRIVFSGNESRDLYIIKVNGESKTKIAASAEAVAWREGEKIAFEKYMGTDYARISLISADGVSEEITSLIGGDVQKSAMNIYYRGRSNLNLEAINAVRIANLDGTGDMLKFSKYERDSLKLSYNNSKIVGGDIDQRVITGIWVVNIDGTNLRELRD